MDIKHIWITPPQTNIWYEFVSVRAPLDSDFMSTQIIWVFLNLHLQPFLETWVISEKKRLNAEFKYTLKVVKNEIFKLSGVNNTWFGVIKVAILQVAFLLPLPGMHYHRCNWFSLIFTQINVFHGLQTYVLISAWFFHDDIGKFCYITKIA